MPNQRSKFGRFNEVMGMSFYDYTNIKRMIHDTDIIELLCFNTPFDQLLDLYYKQLLRKELFSLRTDISQIY